MSTLVRQLSIRSFVCVVILCGVCIILICTTNNLQDRTAVRDTTRVVPTIQTTTFPSDILHDWKDSDTDTLAIYILSAIGFNTSSDKTIKADIRLTAWVGKWLRKATIKCCILLTSGLIEQVKEYTTVHTLPGRAKLNLTVHQYLCHATSRLEDIRGATVQINNLTCPQRNDRYIKPFIPKKVNIEESFAICLKIVYAQVNNVQLQDWLEYNRGMGVDKVFMFTYNITQTTRDLLRPYIQQGYVETRPFAYPWNNTREIGEKTVQVWEDEQAVVLDCLQRLSRYKYLAIIDIDEYLVPRQHDNLKSMMKYLMKKYPTAGGFNLHSYIFNKDVPPDRNVSQHLPEFMRYIKRTKGLPFGGPSRSKNIVLPTRITVKDFCTHIFEAKPGYTRIELDVTMATTNHYRHCYSDMNQTCFQLTTDTYIRKFYNSKNILTISKRLF